MKVESRWLWAFAFSVLFYWSRYGLCCFIEFKTSSRLFLSSVNNSTTRLCCCGRTFLLMDVF